MTIYIVIEQIDLGYHNHCAFANKAKAEEYRQYLSDNDSLVQKRKTAGDPYADRFDIEEVELIE